jgi:hypothetical protein
MKNYVSITIFVRKLLEFWGIAPRVLVDINRCFGGNYCLHNQDDNVILKLFTENLLPCFIYCTIILSRSIYLFISFICSLFNDAFQLLIIYSVKCKGDNWMMNWKGCRRNRSLPNSRYYPGLEGLRKTTKIPVRLASLQDELWIRDLPNTKQGCQLYITKDNRHWINNTLCVWAINVNIIAPFFLAF